MVSEEHWPHEIHYEEGFHGQLGLRNVTYRIQHHPIPSLEINKAHSILEDFDSTWPFTMEIFATGSDMC